MIKYNLALALISITIPGKNHAKALELISSSPWCVDRPGVWVTMLLWPLWPQLCRGGGDLWRGRGLLLLQDRVQGGGRPEDRHVASLRVPDSGQVGLELGLALVSRGVGRGRRGRHGGVHLLLQGGALQWKYLPSTKVQWMDLSDQSEIKSGELTPAWYPDLCCHIWHSWIFRDCRPFKFTMEKTYG